MRHKCNCELYEIDLIWHNNGILRCRKNSTGLYDKAKLSTNDMVTTIASSVALDMNAWNLNQLNNGSFEIKK